MKKQRQEFADLMLSIGKVDERLVVLVGDISHGILQPFANECTGRYFNIGICEPTIVNMAAGLSKVGLVPVIHTIAPFITERAYEQIKLDFGYQKLPVNIISVGGSFDYSQLGCSHHCYSDVSLFMHLEDAAVFLPGKPEELAILFEANYRNNKINYFRLSEQNHTSDYEKSTVAEGRAIVAKTGDDLTLAVAGPLVEKAKLAAHRLNKRGISIEVIYYTTLKPFDAHTLVESVTKTRNLITYEELSSHGGLFHIALEHCIGIPGFKCRQMAVNDFIRGYGTYDDLLKESGLAVSDIVNNAIELLSKH